MINGNLIFYFFQNLNQSEIDTHLIWVLPKC